MTLALMNKAGQALASARLLLEAGDADGATNRAYYAMFDAAIAALAWVGAATDPHQHKTHAGLIGSFGRHLVQAGRLPEELGRSLNRVQDLRLTADYLAEPVALDKAKWAIQEADTFVAGVATLLSCPK